MLLRKLSVKKFMFFFTYSWFCSAGITIGAYYLVDDAPKIIMIIYQYIVAYTLLGTIPLLFIAIYLMAET